MSATNDPSAASAPPVAPAPPPDAATAIQAGPPGEAPIPLPPSPQPRPLTPEELAEEITRLDQLLVLAVLALAFVLASTAVRNHDFWMHLAAGRDLLRGNYTFGEDPYAFTTEGIYWANHAWLFDVLIYGLASLGGGPETALSGALLVGFKGLLMALLAWILLQVRRPDQGLWAPVACVSLALIAMSPRLLLQPSIVSFLFLGVTLWLLTRKGAGAARGRLIGLPVLFALWVNLDAWFLLGPIALALYLLGRLLQRLTAPPAEAASHKRASAGADENAPAPTELRGLAAALVLGLLACLLSPHHYEAFRQLPGEVFSATLNAVHARDAAILVFPSPFSTAYFQATGGGRSAAGVAYFALALLGLVSFGLNHRGRCWWRHLVWLAFLALSLYQARQIPFFAVVAAPITALNLQDFAARAYGLAPRVERRWKLWSLAGRGLTLLVGLLLIAAAWPGWLQAFADQARQSRRVSWTVVPDPSHRDAALQLKAWRDQGLLGPDDRGFNFQPELANYFAWYCPEQKGFFDYRLQLFEGTAGPWVDVRQALRGTLGTPGGTGPRAVDWRRLFNQHRINHLVLGGADNEQTANARRLRDAENWQLAYLNGRTAIYIWKDAKAPSALTAVGPLDLDRIAFGPDLGPDLRAPAQGPGRSPGERGLWQLFAEGPPPRPADADLAGRYLEYHQFLMRSWQEAYLIAGQIGAWSGGVGLAGLAPAGAPGPLQVSVPMALTFLITPRLDPQAFLYTSGQHTGPPAALLLAIRAARRAIAQSPDEYLAHGLLAHAYHTLLQGQEDLWSSVPQQRPLPRQTLRLVQLAAALQNALKLRPDNYDLREKLSEVFFRARYLDLGLEQRQEAFRYLQAAGPQEQIDATREAFQKRLEGYQQMLKTLEREVETLQTQYAKDAANRPMLTKVQLARNYGLAKPALDLLQGADPDALTPAERAAVLNIQIEMLLMSGRVGEVRQDMDPSFKDKLGRSYDWYAMLRAAAEGDYEEAGRALDDFLAQVEKEPARTALLLQVHGFQVFARPESHLQFNQVAAMVQELANYRVIRGLLALEQGDNAAAAKFFQQALDSDGAGGKSGFRFEARPIAVRYLRLLEAAQKR